MKIMMRYCTATLMGEIANAAMTQRSVAMSYHFAMRSDEATDWRAVNAAILTVRRGRSRWSRWLYGA